MSSWGEAVGREDWRSGGGGRAVQVVSSYSCPEVRPGQVCRDSVMTNTITNIPTENNSQHARTL